MTDNEDQGADDDAEERRREPRGSALWEARIRLGADTYRCRVYDFSLSGAKVYIDEPLEPGTELKLHIDQVGVLKGKVAWVEPLRMGIAFTSDAEEVRYLLGPRAKRMGLD